MDMNMGQQQQQQRRGYMHKNYNNNNNGYHQYSNGGGADEIHQSWQQQQQPPPQRRAYPRRNPDYGVEPPPNVIAQVTADPLIKPWTHPLQQKQQQQMQRQLNANNKYNNYNAPDPWAAYMTVKEESAVSPADMRPRLEETAPIQPQLERFTTAYYSSATQAPYNTNNRVAPHAIDHYMSVVGTSSSNHHHYNNNNNNNIHDRATTTTAPEHVVIDAAIDVEKWTTPAADTCVFAAPSTPSSRPESFADAEIIIVPKHDEYHSHASSSMNGQYAANEATTTTIHTADSSAAADVGPSMDELAEAWARMTTQDKEKKKKQQQQQQEAPDTASFPSSSSSSFTATRSPSMEDLAEAWVRMTRAQTETTAAAAGPPASWAIPTPAPASWTPPSSSSTVTNNNNGVAVSPPASWPPPVSQPAGPVLVDRTLSQPKTSTPSIMDLAVEWNKQSRTENSQNNRPSAVSNHNNGQQHDAMAKELAAMLREPVDPNSNNSRGGRRTSEEELARQWEQMSKTETTNANHNNSPTAWTARHNNGEEGADTPTTTAPSMEDLAEAWARMTLEQADPENNNNLRPRSMDDLAEAWARMMLEQHQIQEQDKQEHQHGPMSQGDMAAQKTVNGSTLIQGKPYFAETNEKELVDGAIEATLENLKALLEKKAKIAVEQKVKSLEDLATTWTERKQDAMLRSLYQSPRGAQATQGGAATALDSTGRAVPPDFKM